MRFYLAILWPGENEPVEIECPSLDDAMAGWHQFRAAPNPPRWVRMYYRTRPTEKPMHNRTLVDVGSDARMARSVHGPLGGRP